MILYIDKGTRRKIQVNVRVRFEKEDIQAFNSRTKLDSNVRFLNLMNN